MSSFVNISLTWPLALQPRFFVTCSWWKQVKASQSRGVLFVWAISGYLGSIMFGNWCHCRPCAWCPAWVFHMQTVAAAGGVSFWSLTVECRSSAQVRMCLLTCTLVSLCTTVTMPPQLSITTPTSLFCCFASQLPYSQCTSFECNKIAPQGLLDETLYYRNTPTLKIMIIPPSKR